MKKTTIFIVLLVAVAMLTACSTTANDVVDEVVEEAAEAEGILSIGEKSYTQSDLEALGTMDSDYTNKDGETTTYSGVLISSLLADAGADGDNVTFVASDGYEAEITMAELVDCANCIIAFDDGELRTVLPDFGGKLNVKGIVEIAVD